MTDTPASRRQKAITGICEDSRLWALGRKRRERMARYAVDCVCELKEAGITDQRDIRDVLRSRMAAEFGSIWVMIAFTILWEIIKQYLF